MQFPTLLILSSLFSIASLPWANAAPLTTRAIRDSTSDATTLAAINQLLSLFSQSLDTKDFESLRDVYTEDAVLGGGDGGGATDTPPLVGIEAILDFYTTTFENETLRTQHTVDTVLGANFTETTASSSAYASVYYFGPKVFERADGLFFSNSSAIFREKISYDYVKTDCHWKISRQTQFDILILDALSSYKNTQVFSVCYSGKALRRLTRWDPEDHLEFESLRKESPTMLYAGNPVLSAWPDLMLVSCMEADTLAKMLHGIADSALLESLREWDVSKKMAIIPSMSRQMWENPMTKKQLSKIRRKWPWIRVLEPLTWDAKDGPKDAVYTGVQECVDVLKNQIDLLLLGHDHVPNASGSSNNLITANNKHIRMPSEIWSIILQFTGDWELAKTLGIYTNLPVPAEWQKHPFTYGQNFMRDLEWALLTGKLHDIVHLFQTHGSPKSLSNLCVKLIIRFSRTDVLSYLEKTYEDLFWSQFGHTLVPTKASAFFGQTAVLD
ncbi:MAG: hypothetical protein Q9169_007827, partial [Polycauliona sp. 2 TL-2023]